MDWFRRIDRRTWAAVGLSAVVVLPALIWRAQAVLVGRLVLGGLVAAFVLSPLCEWYAQRMHRIWAVALSYVTVLLGLAAVLLIIVPILIRQFTELLAAIPDISNSINAWVINANQWLNGWGFPSIALPQIRWEYGAGGLQSFLGETASFAGIVAAALSEVGMMLLLSFYFLKDKERLLLHLELLVPSRARRLVLRMASSIRHEMGVYLRGQFTIALAVGTLAAVGLMLAGVNAFLVLGMVIGILNMIPYLGPILGGIPAVLMALTQGWGVTLGALIVLVAVQQIDGWVISPRVMGSVTGLHPALVLLALMAGGSLAGVVGMLFAVPILLASRSIVRIWIMRYEKV